MKINLNALNYLYDYLKNSDKLDENITDFVDFIGYITCLIIDNVEYDYGIDFYEYVDRNDFLEEE